MVYLLSQLTKIYGGRTVLDIPRLAIEPGNIYALLGTNGAGKTTLLNILGFLEAPTTGFIHYRAQPVRYTESELQHLRKEVIIVDQHPILFTSTVYKNLEFGLRIRGIGKKKAGSYHRRNVGSGRDAAFFQSPGPAPFRGGNPAGSHCPGSGTRSPGFSL